MVARAIPHLETDAAARGSRVSPKRRPGFLAGLTFWLLLAIALGGLAPTLWLPELRHLQALHLAEQAETSRVTQLKARIEKQKRLLYAMTSDPGVVARLAKRDLRVRQHDEWTIGFSAKASELPSLAVDDPIVAHTRAEPVWPPLRYDRVFCDPPIRTFIIVVCTGAAALAFGLFGWKPGSGG